MDGLPNDEKLKQIKNFLYEFKELMAEETLFVVDRIKNCEALISLGLTFRQREGEIRTLSVENYCSGPTRDEYEKGDYWVFGKMINGIEVYIKLKITSDKHNEHAVCMSFHPAERPLRYTSFTKTPK
jgi:hypothetical protein